MSKGVQIAAAAIVVAVLLGWYASTTLETGATFQYYQTLQEFRTEGAADVAGRDVRVHGYVSPGTIERDVASKSVRFAVQNDPPHKAGAQIDGLPVLYATLEVPDLFKDGAEVVVEGRLDGSGPDAVFHATNVLAKCPSKFQAKTGEGPPL
jgi:cytochrome c-type biogenesis protein CcmE